jgi:rhamnulokinase
MTASALGHPVEAGPVEATAIGNVISQMVAAGEIASYERGRRLVEMTVDLDRYEPRNWEAWDETVTRMRQLIDGHL